MQANIPAKFMTAKSARYISCIEIVSWGKICEIIV